MKKKIIKKFGWEYLKNWVGIFQVRVFWVGISQRGNLPAGSLIGRNFPGRNFPGGSFPDTEKNICKEFSSVHALTLIFIRKIFILQTHSLRVQSPTNNNFFLWCLNISSSFSTTDWSYKCSYWVHSDVKFLITYVVLSFLRVNMKN